ncbi:MAG: hypothetical protein KBD04_06470 [Proteobacteria bacterium]|nr:hypothetical protein [Pseudomonadota bacterium]
MKKINYQNDVNALARSLLNDNKNFRKNLLLLMDSMPSDVSEKIINELRFIEEECDHLIPLSSLVSKKLEKEQEEWVKSYLVDRKDMICDLISKIESWEKTAI